MGYRVLGFAAAHTAYLYPCSVGVGCAPYFEGFALAVRAFIWYLDGVVLHG